MYLLQGNQRQRGSGFEPWTGPLFCALGKTLNSHGTGSRWTCIPHTDSLASHPGGVVILLIHSCYGNLDKLRQLLATCLVKTLSYSTPHIFILNGMQTQDKANYVLKHVAVVDHLFVSFCFFLDIQDYQVTSQV